jgi:hypothetical protein
VSAPTLQDLPPFAGHAPHQERPLGGYATLTGLFVALCAGFAGWLRATKRELPVRAETRDLVLLAIATHKSARLLAKDRVASTARAPFTTFDGDAGHGEVEESARGRGLRRAVGELLVCPHCLGMWLSAGFLAGLLGAPRTTRLIASAFAVAAGADVLQIAYKKAEDLV